MFSLQNDSMDILYIVITVTVWVTFFPNSTNTLNVAVRHEKGMLRKTGRIKLNSGGFFYQD